MEKKRGNAIESRRYMGRNSLVFSDNVFEIYNKFIEILVQDGKNQEKEGQNKVKRAFFAVKRRKGSPARAKRRA